MAHDSQLPCDGDGVCMRCHTKPLAEQILNCGTCGSGWHVTCLTSKPESLASALNWQCPDCSGGDDIGSHGGGGGGSETELVAAIRRIEADETLTEAEKAKKRQLLLNGKVDVGVDDGGDRGGGDDLLDVLDESFKCSFCMLLPERPVTTPCGHNFCLKCFQKWVGQGKRTCAKCRSAIPPKMASQPRINSTLVSAIRTAKLSKSSSSGGPGKVYHFVRNENRPEKAYTTERAQRRGKSNASSGRIFVTVPPDHFGPILAENDPTRNRGVLVGDFWEDRLECRQWGAHLPHVSGIAGQAKHGAQSVALSGGYIDDEDHGEWFLYTGSGGRDLSGNKRTNKDQSFDQTFENYNEALRLSCKKGYPVRVVRSHKEKRSSYAPETGVRYDGVYRIEKCWRKVGQQGFKVCRYLFVRCDNEPAPWTSDEHGDRPRPLPEVPELKEAMNLTERKESPFWDFDEKDGKWKWIKSPPLSRKQGNTDKGERRTSRSGKKISVKERLLQEFSCRICWKVLVSPVTTPCAHNFCKSCLEGAFAGKSLLRDRNKGGRSLRTQKNIMACPSCPTDIAEFLQDLKVNSELMAVIESLRSKTEENNDSAEDTDEDEPEPGNTESPPSRSEDTDAQNEHEEPPIESKPKKVGRKRKADPGDMSEIPEAKKPATNTDNSQPEIQPLKSTATPEAEVNASDSPSSPLSMQSPDDVE